MKNIIMTALAAVLFCLPALAQNDCAVPQDCPDHHSARYARLNNSCAVQRPDVNPGNMTQRQSRYIISNLGLTGETAARFSELYAAYKQEMVSVKDCYPMHHGRHHSGHHGRVADDCRTTGDCLPAEDCAPAETLPLTDEEIEANILNRFAQARAMVDIREKYYRAFREFLTPGQIQAMYSAERKCAEGLVKRLEDCKTGYRHHR